MRIVEVAGRKIGPGFPCFIIAEAGVNHNGDVSLARQLVDLAAQSGADAVKFQTFKADKVIAAHAPKADYQLQTTSADESQLEMVRQLELSFEAFRELYAYCQAKKILFLSTPFDDESADFLDELGVAAFKVPSGEITNLPFLAHVARKAKPMIVSTGMSYLGEVETAVRTIEQAGNSDIVLLHCTSNYPADPSDVNLRAMHTMAERSEHRWDILTTRSVLKSRWQQLRWARVSSKNTLHWNAICLALTTGLRLSLWSCRRWYAVSESSKRHWAMGARSRPLVRQTPRPWHAGVWSHGEISRAAQYYAKKTWP